MSRADNGGASGADGTNGVAAEASHAPPATEAMDPAEHVARLVRSDLRELAPYPAETACGVRFEPGAETRARLTAALAEAVSTAATFGAWGADEAQRVRRSDLKRAIALGRLLQDEEVVPFTSLAALFAAVFTVFARPRDRQPAAVMLAAPSRQLYKWSARAAGATTVEVPLDADFRPDLSMMARALRTLRPTVIVVGAPHDGSGAMPDMGALRTLLAAARGEALMVVDRSFAAPPGEASGGGGAGDEAVEQELSALRAEAPHLAVARSFEPWIRADLATSWLEIDAELARALERIPLVARGELSPAATAVGVCLWSEGERGARRTFAADVDRLLGVHDRLRARLDVLPQVRALPGRAPFVGVVHDDPVEAKLVAAAEAGLAGISGGGVGRLARTLRIAVADDAEAERALAWLAGTMGATGAMGATGGSEAGDPR